MRLNDLNENNQRPLVSVVLPVYNGAETIRNAVESIFSQTLEDFELIVIDDGSTDNTSEILKSMNDDRLIVLYQENKGIVPSLNRGIEIAKGKYIARMDADDVSQPERLEKQVSFLESNPTYGIVGTATKIVYSNGKTRIRFRPRDTKSILKNFIRICPFSHSSVLIRKTVFEKVGLYDLESSEELNAEDYDMWTRILAARYDMANLSEALVTYYRVSESITRRVSFWKRLKQKMLMRTKAIKELKLSYLEYLNLVFVAILNTFVHFNIIYIDNIFNYLSRKSGEAQNYKR